MRELKNRAEAQLNPRKEEENQILDGERPHPRKKKRLTRIWDEVLAPWLILYQLEQWTVLPLQWSLLLHNHSLPTSAPPHAGQSAKKDQKSASVRLRLRILTSSLNLSFCLELTVLYSEQQPRLWCWTLFLRCVQPSDWVSFTCKALAQSFSPAWPHISAPEALRQKWCRRSRMFLTQLQLLFFPSVFTNVVC